MIHSTKQTSKDGKLLFNTTALGNNCSIYQIIERGSLAKIQIRWSYANKPTSSRTQRGTKTMKLEGKRLAKKETSGEKKQLELLIATKRTSKTRTRLDEKFGNQIGQKHN